MRSAAPPALAPVKSPSRGEGCEDSCRNRFPACALWLRERRGCANRWGHHASQAVRRNPRCPGAASCRKPSQIALPFGVLQEAVGGGGREDLRESEDPREAGQTLPPGEGKREDRKQSQRVKESPGPGGKAGRVGLDCGSDSLSLASRPRTSLFWVPFPQPQSGETSLLKVLNKYQ